MKLAFAEEFLIIIKCKKGHYFKIMVELAPQNVDPHAPVPSVNRHPFLCLFILEVQSGPQNFLFYKEVSVNVAKIK